MRTVRCFFIRHFLRLFGATVARTSEPRRTNPKSIPYSPKCVVWEILRSSPCLHGNAEALWQEYHGLGPKGWPTGLARFCAEAGGRSMHHVRRTRNEPREPRLLWTGIRLSRGGHEGRAREGTLHCSALRWDGG